ncbi:MAG: hypothetical protein U9P10_03340 [Thermodesulfobacteriota bacterium]|nr:hypothetical protein [Thermodesulfobacteriota bacterium]
MIDSATCEAFPYAPLHADEMVGIGTDIKHGSCKEAVKALLSIKTRPFPERIEALIQYGVKPFTRQKIDAVFAECENISLSDFSASNLSTNPDFDRDCERLGESQVLSILEEYPANKEWIQNCLHRFSSAYTEFHFKATSSMMPGQFSIFYMRISPAGKPIIFLWTAWVI